jgi:hypothetical protein
MSTSYSTREEEPMFPGVTNANGRVTISFRDLDAAAFTLAERFGSLDAGPTAWRLLREHIHGRGWQYIFSVWQNFPGRPGAQVIISPQENEVTIWAPGEKPVTMPFRNWQRHALDVWWRACLVHLQPYIPGKPDPDFVYQLINIANQADQTAAPAAEAADVCEKQAGWRILWAKPFTSDLQSHSPYGLGGHIPHLQVFSAAGATATFGVDVVKLRCPSNALDEVFATDDTRLPGEWEQYCRKCASTAAVAPPAPQHKGKAANEEILRTLTFNEQESEAFLLVKAMAEATPGGQVKWSVTRETPDAPFVIRVILDEPE